MKQTRKNKFATRRCEVCRNHFHKSQLLRFYVHLNQLVLDENQIKQNRGYYVCNKSEEIAKFDANKQKMLSKSR